MGRQICWSSNLPTSRNLPMCNGCAAWVYRTRLLFAWLFLLCFHSNMQVQSMERSSRGWQDATDCEDMDSFLSFSSTYDVPNALRNARLFTVVPGKSSFAWNVQFSCGEIFSAKEEYESEWPPMTMEEMEYLNSQYLADLILNDPSIELNEMYYKNKANHGAVALWSEQLIEDIASVVSNCGQYTSSHCDKAFTKYHNFITGLHGIVLGTQVPWAEGALIGAGARRVTTVEYMEIVSQHPRVDTITPAALAQKVLQGQVELVDFIFTFSSIEHDGLGRYGDPINAFGDFETVAKMHCMLKPGGILFLAVPVGRDEVQYNAHRIYGYRRLSVVLAMGFRVLDVINDKPFRLDSYNRWDVQPIFVLQKV
jgi:hypothetical protein